MVQKRGRGARGSYQEVFSVTVTENTRKNKKYWNERDESWQLVDEQNNQNIPLRTGGRNDMKALKTI